MPVAFSWHHDETEQTKQDQGRLHLEKKPQKIFDFRNYFKKRPSAMETICNSFKFSSAGTQ